MSEPRFRVWRVEAKGYTGRISLKPAKTESAIRELFGYSSDVKVTPILDYRMIDGGKT